MAQLTPKDAVGKVVLPVLLHEVNNTTQLLVGLRALLGVPGGEAMFAERSGDLARASETMHDLGFAMAVLATAGGADMLMSRRHPRGVEILWSLTVRALEREADARIEWTGDPPRLSPEVLDGWQAPWSVAALLVEASLCTEPGDWRWEWTDDGALVGRSARARDLVAPALDAIAGRVPGASIEVAGDTLTWSIPREWLA